MAKPTWVDFYRALTAGAQQNTVAKERGPADYTFNTKFFKNEGGVEGVKSAQKGKSVGDKLWHDDLSVGKRVFDVLSRGTYASSNLQKNYYEQGPSGKDNWHFANPLEMLQAAWKGATGEEKTTARDVAEIRGMDNEGWDAAGRNFFYDVVTDPTTYVGAGVIRAALRPFTGAKKAKVLNPTQKAAEEATKQGKATVDVKNVDQFLNYVYNNGRWAPKTDFSKFENTIEGVEQAPVPSSFLDSYASGKAATPDELSKLGRPTSEKFAPPAPRLGAEPRLFSGGGEGISERLMLPGPPPAVSAGRAVISSWDQLASKINQYQYGTEFDEIDPNGFFREIVEQVPEEISPAVVVEPPKVPAPKATKKGADDLPYLKNENPVREAIVNKADEPVKVKLPNGGSLMSSIGELRRIMRDEAKPKVERQMAKDALKKYLDEVEDFAKTEVANGVYKNMDEFLKENGYKASKVGTGTKAFEPPEIPAGPMEKTPSFTEVKRWEKMTNVEKMLFFQKYPFLSKEHIVYLSRAHNKKSWDTRLESVLTATRPTKNMEDLVDAIERGRIPQIKEEWMQEPGMPELLKAMGVTTPKQAARRFRSTQKALAREEKKMFEGLTKNKPVEAATKTLTTGEEIRDVTPVGKSGKPQYIFGKEANEALARAQQRVATQVKPAEKIVEEVKKGDKTSIAKEKQRLAINQQGVLDKALAKALDEEVIKPSNPELYAYVSARGTKRTHQQMHKGRGRNKDVWGTYSQYTFIKSLMADYKDIDEGIKEIAKGSGMRSSADIRNIRATAYYDFFMPVLRSLDNILKEGGVFPVAGTKKGDSLFSIVDVLDALGPEFAKRHFFTMGKGSQNIPPTVLITAMDDLVSLARLGKLNDSNLDVVFQSLLKPKHTTPHGNKEFLNYLGVFASSIGNEARRLDYVSEILSEMVDAVPDLVKRIETNTAQKKLWIDNNADKVASSALDELAQLRINPHVSPGDLAGVAANLSDMVVKTAQRTKVQDTDSIWVAQNTTRAGAAELGYTPELAAVGKSADDMAKAKDGTAKARVATKQLDEAEKLADELAEEMRLDSPDLGTKFERTFVYRMMQGIAPHLGNSAVRPFFLDRNSFGQTVSRGYSAALSNIRKKHTKDAILAGWKDLQLGKLSDDPVVRSASDDLARAINALFSKDPRYNVFTRNNISAFDVNAHFKHFGIHEKYAFDPEDMNNAWRKWDTDNPLDLLSRMQAATMASFSKRMLGADLSRRFGSKTKQPGYVRISQTGSVLAKYLEPDTYFPKDIARQMHHLDEFIKIGMQGSKLSPTTAKALNMYDNILHSWKAGLTIYRPGHHARNMVGDLWLSHMAGVNNPIYYTKAAKLMAQNHGRYRDFDAIKAFMARQPAAASPGKFTDDGSPVVYVSIGGKRVPLSSGEVFRNAFDRGILNDYRTLEDIQMGEEAAFQKFKPFGGKVQHAASSFSESRDHYVRLAHFMHKLENGKYRSIEEAIEAAAHDVRKWHPDGSDLTHFERNVARRSILFYSWMRKAIPLVAESIVMQPGKVMMYPKAMYNIAEANGIDLESLSDPFPTDQLFPDWIKDSVTGPVMQNEGHYWGINPGVPVVDILSDFGNDGAGRQILSGLTPAAKIPIEMTIKPEGAVAQDIRTGIPAFDKSDYADRQIPNFGYIANITGKSPSNLFMQNKGGPEREAPGPNPTSFINFLTGMGFMDMSKPGYKQQAAREQAAKAKERYKERYGR